MFAVKGQDFLKVVQGFSDLIVNVSFVLKMILPAPKHPEDKLSALL